MRPPTASVPTWRNCATKGGRSSQFPIPNSQEPYVGSWELGVLLGRLESRRQIRRALRAFCRLRQCVAHDLLELLEIRYESRTSFRRETIQRLRPAALGPAPRFDETGLLQHVDVPA